MEGVSTSSYYSQAVFRHWSVAIERPDAAFLRALHTQKNRKPIFTIERSKEIIINLACNTLQQIIT